MTSTKKQQLNPLLKLALDLGPLVVFFFANSHYGIFVATATFMIAVLAAMAVSYVLTRHFPIMTVVTAIIVVVFGGLTLFLHDATFIKVKPTIIYALFGAILIGGLGRGVRLVVSPHRRGLAQADAALGDLFSCARCAQRNRLAQYVDQCVGRLQGVRRDAADVFIRRAANAAVEEIRG